KTMDEQTKYERFFVRSSTKKNSLTVVVPPPVFPTFQKFEEFFPALPLGKTFTKLLNKNNKKRSKSV
ncbi:MULTISPECIES: hypothetical protein, partial [unclassified Lactococcus]|uniref:hypothetical protein n=1 Tax=unclassified Lactococcus TaxID=2643510 RepID=UPI001EECD7C5